MRLDLATSSLPWKRLLAEFAVIVAGVLIALAMDSWWERQQERSHAEAYLEQLLVDFEVTERRLGNTIAGDTRKLATVRSASDRALHGPWPPADSLDFTGTGYDYFEPLTGTLTALVQSGDLRLLRSDSIRFELIAFSALIQETQVALQHNETMIWNSIERMNLGRVRHSHSAARRAANAGRGWGQVDVAGALNDPEIISALQIHALASQMRIFNLGRLEEPMSRIIALIHAELN